MKIRTVVAGPIGTNCYILCDEAEKRCAVIDPGGDAKRIAAVVAGEGCTPCAIFLTHGHYDHTGAAEELAQLWNVPVYLNRRDADPADAYAAQLFPPVAGRQDYDEGDVLKVGGLDVTVMATPGHSEGSVVLRCGDVLFCGDTLLQAPAGARISPAAA